jgi:hypothetical protein
MTLTIELIEAKNAFLRLTIIQMRWVLKVLSVQSLY